MMLGFTVVRQCHSGHADQLQLHCPHSEAAVFGEQALFCSTGSVRDLCVNWCASLYIHAQV